MVKKSPALRLLGNVSWVVTALYALNALTSLHGLDLFGWVMQPNLRTLLSYLVGLSGLVSLILWGLSLGYRCDNDTCVYK